MRKHLLWIFSTTYVLALLIAGGLNVWWPNTKIWVEITKIGLSYPVLIFMLLTSLFYLFEDPIRKFLSGVKRVGGKDWEVVSQQDNEDSSTLTLENVQQFISERDSEWQNHINGVITSADAQIENVNQEKEKLAEQIKNLEFDKVKWQFFYADRKLVLMTKHILKLISMIRTFNDDIFKNKWGNIVPNDNERRAMISALLELEFIAHNQNGFNITKIGDLYVAYLEKTGQLILPNATNC